MTTLAAPITTLRANDDSVDTRKVRSIVVRVALVLVAALLLPNLVITGIHMLLEKRETAKPAADVPIKNFAEVDSHLWRGAAPGADGLKALARHGVATVVDLRAEDDLTNYDALLSELGIKRVHIPLRDGQAPSQEQVSQFLRAVEESPGRVFVHCGAGVGRTGTMAASYLVSSGKATPEKAVERNLTVGPPSIEQLTFSARLGGGPRRPWAPVVALSRLADAPRRIWTRARH
jgi:protein tyrosine phosphatase (PTP) superfamily phosphohydrolase (DUF442 family)